MRLDFTKMHGLGNDFIIFDAPANGTLPDATQLRRLAARHTGIGFDQALVLEPPRRAGTSVFYRIFNADGHEVEQCGNGARCVAELLRRRSGAISADIAMDSLGGLVQARTAGDGQVAVDMGVPNFDPKSLPFEVAAQADSYPLWVLDEEVQIGAVSLGNPHAVLTVTAVATAPVERLGPALERHPRFANRVNVGFMEIRNRHEIRLRVYERGVGETLACGSGACAAVAIGRRRGQLDAVVQVHLPGGELRIEWPGPEEHIWLTGPAAVSFQGQVDL
jgi:diaminopimelate epimerase